MLGGCCLEVSSGPYSGNAPDLLERLFGMLVQDDSGKVRTPLPRLWLELWALLWERSGCHRAGFLVYQLKAIMVNSRLICMVIVRLHLLYLLSNLFLSQSETIPI